MPLPQLTNLGLLPLGIHPSTLDEVRDTFCFNPHRERIWGKFLEFLKMLHAEDLAYPIFLAGGFCSGKDQPSDIDVVHDVRGAHGYNQYRCGRLFWEQREAIKNTYLVDYCPNLSGNNDFSSFFQYVGPKVAASTGLDEKDRRGVIHIASRSWLDGLNK